MCNGPIAMLIWFPRTRNGDIQCFSLTVPSSLCAISTANLVIHHVSNCFTASLITNLPLSMYNGPISMLIWLPTDKVWQLCPFLLVHDVITEHNFNCFSGDSSWEQLFHCITDLKYLFCNAQLTDPSRCSFGYQQTRNDQTWGFILSVPSSLSAILTTFARIHHKNNWFTS